MNEAAGGPMERWTAILSALTERDAWGVRELASHLGFAPSVVHRVLHRMEANGLASAVGRGQYRMGPELMRLAFLIVNRTDMRAIARPALEAAARSLEETVFLTVYSSGRRQLWAVIAAETSNPIRYNWENLREWSEIYVGASGLAILAFLEDGAREIVVQSRPVAERQILRDRLAAARTAGFAVSHGERYPGTIEVAAPIWNAGGAALGATGDVVAAWPDTRTNPDKEALAARVVVEAATQISHDLGFRAG
jgi:IclR family transcriptional regulator, acetate operon repressor